MKTWIWVLMMLLAAAGVCRAQDDDSASTQPTPTTASGKTQFKPIEIQTFGWGRHASNGFYYNGLPLNSLQQYEAVIDPLGDAQASQLLRSAGSEDTIGTVTLVGGILLETAGWTDFCIEMINMGSGMTAASNAGTTYAGPNLGPSIILICAGTAGWLVGAIVQGDAGNDRYNAVNRYNYVVQQNQSMSFMMLPNSDQPALAFTQRF